MLPKKLGKDPVENKMILKLCYSYVREYLMLNYALSEIEGLHTYQYIKARRDMLQRHVRNCFSPDIIAACVSSYYSRKLDTDRYSAHRWVAKQVERQWGKSFELWQKARRIEDLFYGLQDIPF
jgi:hypothetical protein